MKEFIEKLIGRLEEYLQSEKNFKNIVDTDKEIKNPVISRTIGRIEAYESTIEIVNQLAEEYNNEAVKGDLISKKAVITELNGIYLDNPWDDKEDILEKAIGIVDHFPTAYNNGWILCSERLPDSSNDVNITTRCSIVGVGSFFEETNEWVQWYCGGGIVVDVIAWQPLPEPYQPKEGES